MAKLPDFLIIGCMKGGTTALQVHLEQHPDIFMPTPKELHFFDANWEKGLDWYQAHFTDPNRCCGEATPVYIYFTQHHEKIFSTVPEAKLILALRDPVKRAYSQWNHCRTKWYDGGSFEAAIERDLKNMEDAHRVPQYEDIIQRGFYLDQIEHLLRFFRREQLLILISEHMKTDILGEIKKILSFLNITGYGGGIVEKMKEFFGAAKVNQIKVDGKIHVRDYEEPLKEETRRFLSDLYAPHNKQLFTFLGHCIEQWPQSGQR